MIQRIDLASGYADLAQQRLVVDGQAIRLTTRECDLLAHLASRPREVVSKEQLLTEVWNNPPTGSEQPILSTIKRLRAKIDRGAHHHLLTVHGCGYRFEPPHVATEPLRAALPDPMALLGREADRQRIEVALARARVVTLVGPPGVGKSSLARTWAQARPGRAFVALGSCRDDGAVLRAIAETLDVPLSGRGPLAWAASLSAALTARTGHVVLDECEGALGPLGNLLEAWPGTARFLLTSREALGMPFEQVVPIEPLGLEDAITLFQVRAAARGREIARDDDVVAIVEQLDCLPLAVELAAAQAVVVDLATLRRQLDARIDPLAPRRRGGNPRHVTLHAAVQVSWDLLEPWEREAWVQCAVFEGGFTAEAVEAVVSVDRPSAVVLEALGARSLLRLRPGGRYELYAAMRAFARELPVAPEVIERHADFFLVRGECLVAQLGSTQGTAAHEALEAETRNLERAVTASSGERFARLTLVVHALLGLRTASSTERAERIARARSEATEPRTEALLRIAEGTSPRTEPERRKVLLEEARVIGERQGDPELEARAAMELGRWWARFGQRDEAFTILEHGLDVARRARLPVLVARLTGTMGTAHLWFGDIDAGATELRTALDALVALDHPGDTVDLWVGLSVAERARGNVALAAQALDRLEEVVGVMGGAVARLHLALQRLELAARTGGVPEAMGAALRCRAEADRLGLTDLQGHVALATAHLHVALGSLSEARRFAESALDAFGPNDVRRGNALETLARVMRLSGQSEHALPLLAEALEIAQGSLRTIALAGVESSIGLCELGRGDLHEAERRLRSAAERLRGAGATGFAALAELHLAVCRAALGEPVERARLLAPFQGTPLELPAVWCVRAADQLGGHRARRSPLAEPPKNAWTVELADARWLLTLSMTH